MLTITIFDGRSGGKRLLAEKFEKALRNHEFDPGDIELVTRCKDCKHSVDYYNDGDCYCRAKNDFKWIEGGWNHYCGYAERKEIGKAPTVMETEE